MPLPELLVASHIVRWADDAGQRMNPRNGLCLNALHDKAFDAGLLVIDADYRVVLSPAVKRLPPDQSKMLLEYDRAPIRMPRRFVPDRQLLAQHRERWTAG
jgi:predicted restriction endonuclease